MDAPRCSLLLCPDNRVTLDREGRIVLSYRLNNVVDAHARLVARLESLMQQNSTCNEHGHECHQGLFAQNLSIGQRIPQARVAHQNGTIRFGRDPRTSNALRVGEHLKERLR